MSRKPSTTDTELIRTIGEYRILTISQLTALGLASKQMARRRLRRLEELGLVVTQVGPLTGKRGRSERIIALSGRGIGQLKKACPRISKIPNAAFSGEIRQVEHQLLLNWFRIFLRRMTAENDLSAMFFSSTSPVQHERRIAKIEAGYGSSQDEGLIPDGVFCVRSSRLAKCLLFFLEVDCGTEPLISRSGRGCDLQSKIVRYRRYLGTGCYKRYEGSFEAALRGFRLLLFAHATARAQQLCRLVRQNESSDFVWISDIEALSSAGSLGVRVWHRGGQEEPQSILGSLGDKS